MQQSTGSGPTEPLTCPSSWEQAASALILWGDTASQRSETLVSERLAVVRAQLESAAGCGIPVTGMWVPSQTTATTLYTGSLRREGANDKIIARLSRKDIEEQAMPAIEGRVSELVKVAAVETSSPTGLFDVIADVRGQTQGEVAVTVLDNFVEQSEHVDVNQPGFDAAAARAAVKSTQVRNLDGARIAIMGVGVTVDTTPAPDDWVGYLRAYADGLCEKTGAACTPATTQYLR